MDISINTFESYSSEESIFLKHELPEITGNKFKINIAFEGKWFGHPNGSFEFNDKNLQKIIDNFNAQKNDLAIRYGHSAAAEDLGMPVVAAGWIKKMELVDCPEHGKELWATAEMTDKAAEMIKNKEYRFSSAEVNFLSKDRKTNEKIGPRLMGLALVNSPYLDSQHEFIELSLESAKKIEESTKKNNIYKTDNEESNSMTAKNKDKIEASEQEKKETELQEDENKTELAFDETAAARVKSIAEKTEMSPEEVVAKMEEKEDELVKLLKGSEDEEQPAPEADASESGEQAQLSEARIATLSEKVSEKDKEIKNLKKELSEFKKTGIKSQVDQAIKSGIFLEKHRDLLMSFGDKDPEGLEKHLSEAAKDPIVPAEKHEYKPKAPSENDSALDVSEETIQKYVRTLSAVRPNEDEKALRNLAIKKIRANQKKLTN